MIDETKDGIARALAEATESVLEDAAISFAARAGTAPTLPGKTAIFATIGFAGDFRGTLMMVATEDVIRAMSSEDVRAEMTSEAMARDWFGELANLTLGRIKSALLSHAVTILLAVPTTGSGVDLALSRASAPFAEWHTFECAAGMLYVGLHADVPASLQLRAPTTEDPSMTEGALLLF